MRRPSFLAVLVALAACGDIVSMAEQPLNQIPHSSLVTVSATPKTTPTGTSVIVVATLPAGATSHNVTFTATGKGIFGDALSASVVEVAVVDSLDPAKRLVAKTTISDTVAETVFVRAIIGAANSPLAFDTTTVVFTKQP